MIAEHLGSFQPINLYDIPIVREQYANVPSQVGLNNFLLGAAYCGNDEGSLIGGLGDSRNGLTREHSERIIVDALQQLITITTKAKNDPIVTDQERSRLLLTAVSLTNTCDEWAYFMIPEVGKVVKQTVEQWGKEVWKEEWTKAADKTSNFWFISSHLDTANSHYMGPDFVGHCLANIKRERVTVPADVYSPWNDISHLRIFWEQHRRPTRWERLIKRIPESPY